MPNESEHAARILDPDKFQQESFRRKNIALGVDIIIGKLIGEDKRQSKLIAFQKKNSPSRRLKPG